MTERELLRHTLAALAYRSAKALRDPPAGFARFRGSPDARTPLEILAHMGDLMTWALSIAQGREQWLPAEPVDWDSEEVRYFAAVRALDDYLDSNQPLGAPIEKLFQGPIADALTHTGQLAMLRRMAGSPVRGENYFRASIAVGWLGRDQAAPRREFD